MKEVYGGMFERAVAGKGYHISSHIERSTTCLGMKVSGRINGGHCMSRALWESPSFGVAPRHLEHLFNEHGQDFMFDVAVNIPAGLTRSA